MFLYFIPVGYVLQFSGLIILKEMEKKREERRIQAELWREWSRHRDDLECDDLKVIFNLYLFYSIKLHA